MSDVIWSNLTLSDIYMIYKLNNIVNDIYRQYNYENGDAKIGNPESQTAGILCFIGILPCIAFIVPM